STGITAKYAFWRDELEPAVEEGLDVIRETDHPRLEALYHDALDVGRRQDVGRVTAYGPAFQARVSAAGWEGAVGGGLFGTGAAAGVPHLDFYGQADVIVPVAAAVRVPGRRSPWGWRRPTRAAASRPRTPSSRRSTPRASTSTCSRPRP